MARARISIIHEAGSHEICRWACSYELQETSNAKFVFLIDKNGQQTRFGRGSG